MSSHTHINANPSARTHAEAAALFRRPFAPGAIGFRAMTKVPFHGQPYAGAQVAAYIGAQSVIQRLNAVVPGGWRQQFQSIPAEFVPAASKRTYLACRLTVTLPVEEGGPDVDAVYEDLGEMDSGSFAGLKALYSDARKRAAVAAGIGAYLYTSLEAVVLPIGPNPRQVQAIRRPGKSDLLALSPETEQWLRHGYQMRMSTEAVRRDLGEISPTASPRTASARARSPTRPRSPPPRRPPPTRPARRPTGTVKSSLSTSATSDRRPRDEHDPDHRGGRGGARRRAAERGRASRADPGATAAAAALRRPAAPAPLALQLQPLRALPRGLAPALRARGEDRPDRLDVPRPPGRRRDHALLPTHPRIRREHLSVDQIKDAFWDGWKAAAEAERAQLGIAWETDLREDRAFKVGLDAVELTFSQLIPKLGEPVAVQRQVEYTLAPGLEWSVLCYLDLETRRPDAGTLLSAVIDYKVKTTPLTQYRADHDFQPAVDLAGRWLEGDPAAQFCFAQIAKPGPRRKQIGASIVTTTRSTGQRRGALVRIAQVARQIVACHERFGPDQPWGFADPGGWKCSERYCEAWATCPGGRGL